MKKKKKDPSFDVMIRFFLQYYGIATKQDIERILARLDRLEGALKAGQLTGKTTKKLTAGRGGLKAKRAPGASGRTTAREKVLSILRKSPKGEDVKGLKEKSGFEDKKIRNILFRLSREGTVKRIGRGVYAIQ
jgi:hypothetical protein